MDVVCRLWVECYIAKVIIVECNLSITLNNTHFYTRVCLNFFFALL